MYTSKLSDFDLESFKNIHSYFLPNRNKDFNRAQFMNSYKKKNNKKKKIILPIINKSYQILESQNINNYDRNNYYIEFHQRNCGFEKTPHSWLVWHKDDYGAVPFKVYSILFYIRKDISVKGGNLLYKINNKEQKHIVNKGDILSFRGDLSHIPEDSSGFGCRDLIVVFIKRN